VPEGAKVPIAGEDFRPSTSASAACTLRSEHVRGQEASRGKGSMREYHVKHHRIVVAFELVVALALTSVLTVAVVTAIVYGAWILMTSG